MNYAIGYVIELRANSVGKDKDGIVTVIDNDNHKTKVSLSHDDYIKAIDAHLKGFQFGYLCLEN